jgi:hypothetical protein
MIINCIYNITIPQICTCSVELEDNTYIRKVIEVLNKYGIEWYTCDTISGWFNLNQEWIETKTLIEMETGWNFVLPLHWDKEDRINLKSMVDDGKIIIIVHYVEEEDGKRKYTRHH